DDMKLADVMPHLPEHLPEGCRREGRAIGGDTAEGQAACYQGRVQTPQKGPDIIMGGIVIQHLIEDALVAPVIDYGQNAEGTIREFIGGHIARNIRQGPVKEVRVQARLRLFFPQPRPSSEWSQKGQRHDGRARGASSPGGRASRPRPRAAPPDRSPGGYTACPAGPDQRGRRSSTCDTAYRNAGKRSPADPADTTDRDAPHHAAPIFAN